MAGRLDGKVAVVTAAGQGIGRAIAEAFLRKGAASIVNIPSGASTIKAAPNRYVYASTKAAVIGLTKAVAIDFITKGVRCNCICPGTVQSPSLDARIETLADSSRKREDEVRRMFIERQPMGRLGTAEEIAPAALYLAGDESAFTTGTAMIVDG